MLTLRTSKASPFGRKIKIGASLLDLTDRIELVDTDTLNPDAALLQQNPLGKIPTLVLENGETLYDSRVILEYLDDLAGGGHLHPAGADRFAALRHQALADGIMDAALIQVYEVRWRSEESRNAKWTAHQGGKVARGLDYVETHYSTPPARFHVGHVTQACALGYLDLRMNGAWRQSHPRLVPWLADFQARVPMFEKTIVKP